MAGFFTHLFDDDYRQRNDIEALQLNSDLDTNNINRLRRRLDRAERRLDRAELVLEALFVYLENQELVNRETLARLIREVDLLDGKEDGRAKVKPTEDP